jgi:aminopeptidase N
MKTDVPRPIQLKHYAPPAYVIDTVDLDVSLHPTATRVRARLKMRRNPSSDAGGPLLLDGEALQLELIKLDGRALGADDYTVTASGLTIADVPAKPFKLEIITVINPEANTALQGLYRSKGVYCTQCEAQGFRRITYFLDRPDVLARYTTRIEADINEAPVLLGNGNPVERGTLDQGRRHYAVWKDPHPKPYYLFALVGGNLLSTTSQFRTMSGRKVDLTIYVEPGKEDRCGWAMDSLKRSMAWDERRFGREYDLDVFNIVAVSDFNMGAMENKGLNIFNDRLVLASADTATDAIYEAIEAVIAHEYFHNWTGNRITCRDWFQLCLKEGLTVFRDQEFSADERSRTAQRIQDVRQLKARQFPEDAGPLAHPVRPESYIEINNFYTATVYEKGAEVCRMLQTILGAEAFARGLDLYFERHDGDAATVEDFLACFADATGADLTQFKLWYAQAGTPEVIAHFSYDAGRRRAELTLEQVTRAGASDSKKKPFHIPIALGLLGSDGQDLPLHMDGEPALASGLIHLTKRSQTYRFTDLPERPVLSLLREFSAPVNLTINQPDEDLAFLMRHDSDLYNRWQAGQDYALRVLLAAVTDIKAGVRPPKPQQLIEALRGCLEDAYIEPAVKAQMLWLPGDAEVARRIGADIDPTAIHAAVRGLRRQVATALGPILVETYAANANAGAYSPDAESAGRRALRNAALALLTARGRAEDIARTAAHFASARNATDEIDALALLSNVRGPERKVAFDRFYDKWKSDHLVIDHWFSLQAASSLPTCLTTVQRLLRDPLFQPKNPNKLRGLIGVFAANAVNFNRQDGAGYTFVATKVLEIDAFNPQVASRILTSFRSWRSLEPVRRKRAKRELARIAKAKGLSRDVHEIVTRMLDA